MEIVLHTCREFYFN